MMPFAEGKLQKAGIEDAKAIPALLDDDSENAFMILAVKELTVRILP